MNEIVLTDEITAFLATSRAGKLCRDYHAQPEEALGELFIRLRRQMGEREIRNPAAWVHANGMGLLRNYLRREHLTLV